ncbi:MAG: hypothetical protein HDQ99_19910 [Lachnospiraceae bacterium]|nr:hypothetical protein [Lachnospiraceae bacterium]
MADIANDFLFELQAALDTINSVKNIDKDIEKIKDQVKQLQIQAKLDPNTAQVIAKELEKVIGQKIVISNIGIDTNFGNKLGKDFGKAFNDSASKTINTNISNQVNKISDSSTSTIVQNEKKKQEAYKATSDAVIYHAGVISKLNKAETNGRFYGSNRGTGYFGTGHYFVDSKTKHELDNNSSYSKLPYTSVDISQYDNLFKANTDEIANNLHSFLANLTKFTQGSDKFNIDELFSQFKNVFADTTMDIKDFGDKMEQLKTFMSNSNLDDRSDSVSTQFMKSIGYGGVDTRGTNYADTRYGTVIYDLKEESVLQANITDELQKQGQMLEKINYEKGQVFDSSADVKIQAQIDAQNRAAEIKAEFHKIFDTTELDKTDSELSKIQNRLSEINKIISSCESAIESAEEDQRRFAKEMEDFDLFMTEDEIQEGIESSKKDYQDRINELSLERTELEKRIPVLEENLDKQYQLANEARKQAEQIVEQQRQEVQQSSSAANEVIQNEEKKQQATQESIKLQSELASFNEKFKETGIATINNDGVVDMKKSLEEVRNIYSDFGKVTIKNEMSDLVKGTEQFRVSIESSNGELKRTESFLMKLSEDGKSFVFADDMIRSSESTVRHLNEQQEAVNKVILEEEKLANAMGDVREKSEQIHQAEEKRQQAAQNKAINKALEDEYMQRQKLAEQVDEIQLSIGDKGNTTAQIKIITDSFTKLGLSTDEVKTKMSSVDQELITLKDLLKSGASDSDIISQFNKLNSALGDTQNDLKMTRSEYSLLVSDQQRLAKANVIEAWNLKNKNATQEVRNANEAYIASLRDLKTEMTRVKYNDISDGFSRVKNSMTALGKVSTAVKGQIAQVSSSLISFMSLSRFAMQAVNWLTKMPSTVRTLDTALVDLKKTANMSAQELEDFYYSSNKVAKQMGVTTEEILTQASSWSRLGYNTAEAATQMAKLSSQFALISPGLSVDDATSGLVSIMKAYNISVSDVLDGIESKVNIIGNNLALSNANIVKMLQDSVSAMAEGRNTLEETIALEAAAYEITQNESVGNGFKTVALRLRGMNEETEELDDSLKTIKGDLYELTGVSIMEDEHTYKSTYQILKEISEVWDSLTDTKRADALELMFGKQRSNIGAAVLKNFSAAEKAMDLMSNSAGNANAELSVAMDSIEYKMNRLSETGTSVAQNLFKREDMKSVIDVLTYFMNILDKVTEKLGLFGSIGIGAGLFASFKNIGKCRMSVRIS